MLAAVLMVTAMQIKTQGKGLRTPPEPDPAGSSNKNSKEHNEVSIPVCGGMHLDAYLHTVAGG